MIDLTTLMNFSQEEHKRKQPGNRTIRAQVLPRVTSITSHKHFLHASHLSQNNHQQFPILAVTPRTTLYTTYVFSYTREPAEFNAVILAKRKKLST